MKDSKDLDKICDNKALLEAVNEFRIMINEINDKLDYMIRSLRDYYNRAQYDPNPYY